jgi:hypothetical protein
MGDAGEAVMGEMVKRTRRIGQGMLARRRLGARACDRVWVSSLAVSPELRSEAELVALVHIGLAKRLWQQSGGGEAALAHRLAASLLLSLLVAEPQHWRLSAAVRDIVALGEAVLPCSLTALVGLVEPLVGRPYRVLVEELAGGLGAAERRFGEVIGLATGIARQIGAHA